MKLHDFENSPLHTSELPVESAAEALASNSPAALPTSAPAILILETRALLNMHWLSVVPSYAAISTWHAFIRALDARQLRSELN